MTIRHTNDPAETLAHFDSVAARWAQVERLLDPVTPGLASGLGPLRPGSTLLDIACGAGEPGLSLVATDPAARLVGIDIAPAMVERARREARRRGAAGASFTVGSADRLPVDDASVDAAVSRMGLFGFPGSTVRSAHEAFRVLRPGGRLAVAVWDRPELNAITRAGIAAYRDMAGPNAPDFGWLAELADGRRELWLREAGFVDVVTEPVTWQVSFADLDDLWAQASEFGPLALGLAGWDDASRAAAREHLARGLAEHRTADGTYVLPASARLLTAARPRDRG